MADDNSTVPSQCNGRGSENKQPAFEDSISSLPDDILHHILCSVPTKFVIRTSVLSKRWRYVWCNTPSLSFYHDPRTSIPNPAYINETLKRYMALKMMSFHVYAYNNSRDYIDKWIEFAMSRNVENLSFLIWLDNGGPFEFPDLFYNNSSLKQLTLRLKWTFMNLKCSVSWTSLKNLSMRAYKIRDESIAKILSGCPILECLTLYSYKELKFLDLSKYPCLRTLQLRYSKRGSVKRATGPTQIVAPHIHSLILKNVHLCTLLDVSSLTEAKLDILYSDWNEKLDVYFFQAKMLLEKLHNLVKLTLGETCLQILSLAEIRADTFPMFKVKYLTLETSISRYVTRGIERMLQNSPDVKKITLDPIFSYRLVIPETDLDTYVINLTDPDQCWRSKNGSLWNQYSEDLKTPHVVSFIELVLENAKALEKLVVKSEDCFYCRFEKIVPTLSNKNNVSIVLSTKSS